MDHNQLFFDALQKSVEEAFSSTVMISPTLEDSASSEGIKEGLILSIDIAGPVSGQLSVCFSHKSAALIVSKMLGMDIEEGSSDASDGIGEIANMVIGGIKNKIDGSGLTFDLSSPQVIEAKDLTIESSGATSVLDCNYLLEDIVFKVLFAYEINEQTQKKDEGPSQAALDALALLGGLGAEPSPVQEKTPEDQDDVQEKKEESSQAALDALALLGGLQAASASVEEKALELEKDAQEQSHEEEENVEEENNQPSPDLQSAKDSLNEALRKFEDANKKII